MFEAAISIVLILNLALMAAWLTTGAVENVIHPFLNESFTAEVLDMTRMRQDYPEAYAHVAYRRIESAGTKRLLFRIIVGWELLAVVALWTGTACLAMASLGALGMEAALTAALIGTAAFTATWAGFLVGGNWFCYWFGYENSQATHYLMTLWGISNLVLLLAAAPYLL